MKIHKDGKKELFNLLKVDDLDVTYGDGFQNIEEEDHPRFQGATSLQGHLLINGYYGGGKRATQEGSGAIERREVLFKSVFIKFVKEREKK